jgi:hypothetical protein
MIGHKPVAGRVTLGGDKGYDTQGSVKQQREINVTPHVAQNVNRSGGSAIDARTTRHEGYVVSQRNAKGWKKYSAGSRA